MNDDYYVNGVLSRHRPLYALNDAQAVRGALLPTLQQWSNGHLYGVYVVGSLAKGTAISGTTDVDLLISMRHTTPNTLQELYNFLFNWLTSVGLNPSRQNVSLGIRLGQNNEIKVDIVPAKKQSALSYSHSIWSHKSSTWRQTNVHQHVRIVANSRRLREIRAIKIWRKCHNLDFPSFLLEMTVIRALAGNSTLSVARNFVRVLEYIRDQLPSASIIDPSNTNNNVADELTLREKQALSQAAAISLNQNWPQVIW